MSSVKLTSALAPEPPADAHVPVKKRQYPGRKPVGDYVSGRDGCALTNKHWKGFLVLVEQGKVRTRMLPGDRTPMFNREDLERIVRESTFVGLPPQYASA